MWKKSAPLRIQRLNGEENEYEESDNRRGILRTIPQEREYPDPRTLPAQPSWQQPRPAADSLRINARKICGCDGQNRPFENI